MRESGGDRPMAGDGREPRERTGRTAVVVVHGVGQQRPMTMVREVAHSYVSWCRTLPGAAHTPVWSVPDVADSSFELSSFVIPSDAEHPQQLHLYEGYWAGGVTGTRWTHLLRWTGRLLLRSPRSVPRRLLPVWGAVWLTLTLLVATVAALLATLVSPRGALWWTAAGAVAVLALVGGVVLASLGDAARYVDDRAENVAVRHAVRRAVVQLLEVLHDSRRYDEIVVIGHSLGGIVAYDALRILWARRTAGLDVAPLLPGLATQADRVETLARTPVPRRPHGPASGGPVWRVSDLLTVGSPIAYASVLIARRLLPLEALIEERAMPTAPPQPAHGIPGVYWYPVERGREARLHHGAMFSATRWTNVHARADFLGGPVTDLGADVRNHVLDGSAWTRVPGLSHAGYWRQPDIWPLVQTLPGFRRTALGLHPTPDPPARAATPPR